MLLTHPPHFTDHPRSGYITGGPNGSKKVRVSVRPDLCYHVVVAELYCM